MPELTLTFKGQKYQVLYDEKDQHFIDEFDSYGLLGTLQPRFYVAKRYYRIDENGKKKIFYINHSFARLLLGLPRCDRSIQVDHINHNTLDNRRLNLRACTHQQNQQNRFKNKGRYSSKYIGVNFYPSHSKTKPWRSSLRHNHKDFLVGYFKTEIEAAQAFDKKALEVCGSEFKRFNFKNVEE
jgi:hypothetical protein